MMTKVNKTSFLFGATTLLLALGLMAFVVQDTKRVRDDNNITQKEEEADVKGEYEIMAATCGQGTYTWHGCTACDVPPDIPNYQCGGSLTYLCGSKCLSQSCGAFACTCSEACTCTPTCTGNYQDANNGCGTQTATCTGTNECNETCTNQKTCYAKKFNLVYTAGTGGTITGTTNQSVCYNTNGTQVTAVANTGYAFSKWSDDKTTASRTDLATTNLSVNAIFVATNGAPTAPTSLLTNGLTNPTGVTTVNPYFSAIFNDPNVGNSGVFYQIQVNTNSAFTGTMMWDNTKTAITPIGIGSRSPNITYAGNALSLNGAAYFWRIRFWDNNDAVGAWSATAQFTMLLANNPSAPTSLLANGSTNPVGLIASPYFSAIFNDPDTGNTGNAYRIQVNTNSAFTGTMMWDSNKASMTSTPIGARSPNLTYAGTTLPLDGVTYYWRIKFWDNTGLEGVWSTPAQFKMNTIPSAPTSLLTDGTTNPTATGSNPYFSAVFNDSDAGNTGVYYQIQVNTTSAFTGTSMWDSGKIGMNAVGNGTRTPDITYTGSALDLGGSTYYWRIRLWDNLGIVSPWSSTAQFTTSSYPSNPSDLLTNGLVNPVNVVPTPPPYFSAIFNHPDTNRSAVFYRIEVAYTSSFSSLRWDSGKTAMTATNAGTRSPNLTYGGNAFYISSTPITYYWRITFWDDIGLESPVSPTGQLTINAKPSTSSLLTEGQTNPTGVTDLTPEFSAIFNDTTGNTGVFYQIQVNTSSAFNGTTMWDSNKTAMSAIAPGVRMADVSYAGATLAQNGQTLYWRIKFWDNYGAESDWSSTNRFTMYYPTTTITISTSGTQTPELPIDATQPTMEGVFGVTSTSGNVTITSLTFQRNWTTLTGTLDKMALFYTLATDTCPETVPASYSQFGAAINPATTVTINGSATIPANQILCVYVNFSFTEGTLSAGDELDYSITNFTASVSPLTKIGLPANVSGTTLFVDPPSPPLFTEFTNNSPVNPGDIITFSSDGLIKLMEMM